MIAITRNFRSKYPGAVRKWRNERIRVVKLESDLYYVARRAEGHGQYLVRFFHKGKSVSAVCANIFNQACKGTWGEGKCCTHIAAAVERGIQLGKKQQRRVRIQQIRIQVSRKSAPWFSQD